MACSHFGVITPSDGVITQGDPKEVTLQVKFIHPLEGHYMEMEKPKSVGVFHGGRRIDLTMHLQPRKGKGPEQDRAFTFWELEYLVNRPGDHTFYVEPAPYWEPAEDVYIVHYTKVCVHAFGLEQGWDEPVGLEAEIIPLTRPYGLWTGNVFTGQVLYRGKPVPHAEIEVEYLNESPGNPAPVVPPDPPFTTQVLKADAQGIFTYAMPRAGWWGFAALLEAPWKLPHAGEKKGVEIGAVYWVQTSDML